VAAAKSLVALALAFLFATPGALADNPTVHIVDADQSRAVSSLLQLKDFASGWQGGQTKTHTLSAPSCPGFDPKESDLVVSGHADAQFTYPRGSVTFNQDVQVLHSDGAVRTDFSRTITPKLPACLAYQLHKAKDVVGVKVERLAFPSLGSVSAAFRATLTLKAGTRTVKVYDDFVFFGVGRVEYAINVLAPAALGKQLAPFESTMAALLVKRAAKPCC